MKKFYYNSERNAILVSKKSNSIQLLLLIFCFGFMSLTSYAATNTWKGPLLSSSWNTDSNWSLDRVPIATDDVIIPTSSILSYPVISTAGAVCKSLTINNTLLLSNILTINSPGTLTVTEAVKINNLYNFILSVTAGSTVMNVGSGTLTAGSIEMNDAGGLIPLRDCILSISTGTVNVTGNITMAGSSTMNNVRFTGAGILNIGGTMTGGGLIPSTGTVNYNNLGNQAVGTYGYYNLTSSGSGIKSLDANTTVSNALSVKANTTLELGAYTLSNPTSVLLECGATTGSIISGTGIMNFRGNVNVTDASEVGTSGATISCPSKMSSSTIFNIADDGSTAADLKISNMLDGISATSLTKSGVGTMLLSGTNGYTGPTIINAGILQLGGGNAFSPAATALFTLGGGTLSTGLSVGYPEDAGALKLLENATISLGTGSHNLQFTNSSAITWTNGKILTITGWTGTARHSGTSGKIFVGTTVSGLTTTQLAQITFAGYSCSAMILSTGEIVPSDNVVTLSSAVGTNNQTKCINTAITNITYTTIEATGIGTSIGLPAGVTAAWNSNTITISGTPTVSGTFNYTIPLTGGCGTVAATGTITVMANNTLSLTSGLGSNNPSVCVNSPITNITYSTTGATGATVTGLPTGLSGSWSANVITISGTPSVAGVALTYTVSLTGGCVLVTTTGAITVNSAPTTPTVVITQPSCLQLLGSVALSGLPASGTINQAGTESATYTITGTTMTIPNLAAGTYQFSLTNGCTSASTSDVVIDLGGEKIWTGTWSPSAPRNSGDIVIMRANYNAATNGDLNVCSLTIDEGYILTVESGKFVTIENNLTVNGTLNVLDKGSLVMVNDAGIVAGTGTTNVYRTTTTTKKSDYVYWSIPSTSTVTGNTPVSSATFLGGWKIAYAYEYIPKSLNYNWTLARSMTPAKGYIVMVPDKGGVLEAKFTGKLNNGVQKVTGIMANKSYLVGNPYASAIDADAFITENANVIDGTLYFWTHNTAIQLATNIKDGTAGSGAYAYTSNDYATFNRTGGTSPAKSGGTIAPPTGEIASTQGFFVNSNSSAELLSTEIVFKNSMRIGADAGPSANSQFFRTTNSKNKKTAVVEKNRIWLNLSNDKGAFKQTLLGYIGGATNDVDSRFDGVSLDGNDYVDFYSVNQNKNLTIQGRALPFDENDEVPLGYRSTIDGTFTISIDRKDGFLTNQSVFLEDKLTNSVVDLNAGSYSFTATKGTSNDRFVLKYVNKTLGVDNVDKQDGITALYASNYKTLIIKNEKLDTTVNSVILFNTMGQKIENWDVQEREQSVIQIPIKNLSSGVYIVKIKTTNGEFSKKIVVN